MSDDVDHHADCPVGDILLGYDDLVTDGIAFLMTEAFMLLSAAFNANAISGNDTGFVNFGSDSIGVKALGVIILRVMMMLVMLAVMTLVMTTLAVMMLLPLLLLMG